MKIRVDLSKVVPSSEIKGEDETETAGLKRLLEEANKFLATFDWCVGIKDSYLGIGIAGVIGVFLFKIAPRRKNVDTWIWVVVGDIPPAYISAESNPNPASALFGYIWEMRKWIKAVKLGKSVEDLMPVNIPPTSEWAIALERRLKFFDEEILAKYQDDLRN